MANTPNLDLVKEVLGNTSWKTDEDNNKDKIDASFDPATGHVHDGTTPGSGPNLPTTAITGLAEFIRDTIGAALVAGTRVTITVDDPGNTITITSDDASTAEFVRDTIGTALVAGSGISVTVNDGADTITIASTITQYTDEMVDDRVAVLLVAGVGVTLAYNDGANTLTVSANSTGLSWKAPVRAASTTNHTLTAPGATVDGVSLTSGDRILLKNQTAPAENGIYVWNGASSTATRATDADAAAEVLQAAVFTEEGTQADTLWVCTTDAPITLGSTSLTFVNIGSVSGGLLASNNLSDLANTTTARTNLGLGTSAVKNIPASGDAAVGEVVYGTDTRLTNSRTPSGHHASHESGGTDALTGIVPGSSFAPTGLTGATSVSRYVGATTSGSPGSGTFNTGDFIIARDGGIYICTAGGTPGTWATVTGGGGSALTVEEADASPTDSAVVKIVTPNDWLSIASHIATIAPKSFAPSGLTGAVSASRYVGATASGAPTTGTFITGDWIITLAGSLYICTSGGSPGTWSQISSSGLTNPMTTDGDMILGGSSGTPTRLAKGSDNYVLGISATTHLPVWMFNNGGGGGDVLNPMIAVGDLIIGGASNIQNVALSSLGATASGASAPTNAIDNNGGTYWQEATKPGTLTIDLGAPFYIAQFRLTYYGIGNNWSAFNIDSSIDNVNWIQRYTVTGDNTVDTGVRNLATAATARYWRFVGVTTVTNNTAIYTAQLITGGVANGYPVRLAVGSDDQNLIADSTQPYGLKWGPRRLYQTLTDAATIAWDTRLGNAQVTLGGNRTLGAPSNLLAGQIYFLIVIQDGTGSRTLTWNSVFKWAAGTAPTLSTGTTKKDIFQFDCDGTNLYCVSQQIDVH